MVSSDGAVELVDCLGGSVMVGVLGRKCDTMPIDSRQRPARTPNHFEEKWEAGEKKKRTYKLVHDQATLKLIPLEAK